jgi:hypothetical protein
MVNYQLGKIYRLVCNTTGLVYVGSTCEKTLAKRLQGHKNNYNQHLKGNNRASCSAFKILEGGDYDIILIESIPCASKDELHRRERFYIESLDCVNKAIPTQTLKEYNTKRYVENREFRKEKDKEYYEEKRDEILEKKKLYYEKNKELILDNAKKHRETEDKELRKEIMKQYSIKNKEILKEKSREYRKNNEEKRKIYMKKYYQEHKQKIHNTTSNT